MPDVALLEEESGFFDAEEIEKEDGTKDYDRVYTSEQFAQFFSLFVGNGVFVNPTNQLLVTDAPGSIGLKVKVKAGWAFINGMYYHNTADGEIALEANTGTTVRTDGIFCCYSKGDRKISVIVGTGRTVPRRTEYLYELLLATVNVASGALSIAAVNVKDKRPDEDVCGFVKGLVDVIQTQDLFDQFTANFNNWLEDLNDQFGEDAVGSLLNKINTLKTDTENSIAELENNKANNSIIKSIDIDPSLWSGTEAPFLVTIDITEVEADSIVDVGLDNEASLDEINVWLSAGIIGGTQGDGFITLQALGDCPMVEVPITVVIRG